jgi:hypothetical protein
MERRPVYLRDRSGRQRLCIELGEDIVDAVPQLFLDRAFRNAWLEGRHRILQQRELGYRIGREQVGPSTQCLAELDERRTKFLERKPETNGTIGLRMAVMPEGGEYSTASCQVWPQVQRIDDIHEPELDEDADDLAVPSHVRHT